jgi:ribosome-associated translation inhibitor RaiA
VPGDTLLSKEGTLNMYAAIDIVEAKLKAQIRSYKEIRVKEPRRGRMLTRLLGRRGRGERVAGTAPEAE